ncbi:MAG: glycosyltransferase family 1 protein [Acidobacteria bacterium]|nr:MAG: glycosyltransferase family 1 protein [Acidobacteriota bacterium]
MRMVFLVESLEVAGAERVVQELARMAQGEGSESYVVTLREMPVCDGLMNRDVQEFPLFKPGKFSWPWSALQAARRLRRIIDRLQPDVMAIHTPKAAVVAALAAVRVPALWVLHGHDVCWDGATARHRLSRGLQRWVQSRLGGHVAAVSPSLADHAALGLGMPREEIAVLPNGVNTEQVQFEERRPTDDVVVCVLGRLIAEKGPGQALEGFGALKKQFPAARLWFVGDGPMRNALAAEVTARGWNKAVTFWGMQQQPETQLRQATVLWMPSESEGFGIACAEAMASGLPVLGFDVRGVRDLLQGGCGVLVPPKDARELAAQTVRLVRDGPRYQAMARAARARVEGRYSFRRTYAGHYQLMRALCRGESGAGQYAFDGAEFSPQKAGLEKSRD